MYYRDCHFPVAYSWLLCHKLIDHIPVSLFLGSLVLFYIGMFSCKSGDTICVTVIDHILYYHQCLFIVCITSLIFIFYPQSVQLCMVVESFFPLFIVFTCLIVITQEYLSQSRWMHMAVHHQRAVTVGEAETYTPRLRKLSVPVVWDVELSSLTTQHPSGSCFTFTSAVMNGIHMYIRQR